MSEPIGYNHPDVEVFVGTTAIRLCAGGETDMVFLYEIDTPYFDDCIHKEGGEPNVKTEGEEDAARARSADRDHPRS